MRTGFLKSNSKRRTGRGAMHSINLSRWDGGKEKKKGKKRKRTEERIIYNNIKCTEHNVQPVSVEAFADAFFLSPAAEESA